MITKGTACLKHFSHLKVSPVPIICCRSTINHRPSIPRNESIISKLQSAFSGSKSGFGSTFSIFGGGRPSQKGRVNQQRRASRLSHIRMSQGEDQVPAFVSYSSLTD